jgi:hypothetical protein
MSKETNTPKESFHTRDGLDKSLALLHGTEMPNHLEATKLTFKVCMLCKLSSMLDASTTVTHVSRRATEDKGRRAAAATAVLPAFLVL